MIKKSKLTRLIMTGAILALTGTTNAQSLDFYKKYKVDEVNLSEQVKVSADSNLLLLGTIRRANSLGQIIRDMLLVKTDLSGDTLWTKYIGLDDRSETGRDFEILDNGNMLITGFSAYDMGSKVKGFLMCVDAGGNLLWDKYYGNETDIYAFTSLKIVEDGVILAGTIDNGDNSDALILKTTMTGDSLWSTTVGGAEYDAAMVPVI